MVNRRTLWNGAARLNRRAVALIDVIVGTVLLGVTIAVLMSLLGQATASQAMGEQMATAARLIDEQLNLVLARGPDNYATRFEAEGVCEAPFEGFRYRLTFTGGTGGQPYVVRSTVLWDSGSVERSASVEALIAARLGDEADPERKPTENVDRPIK
ncbi:MAG: hypothetical protein AABZ53_10075 [Planctomycetota bacterium]